MAKTPQVTPDWTTGIYIGDGVVANKPEGPAQRYPSLIDRVVDQIREDIELGDTSALEVGDVTAIEELLKTVDTQVLVDYLPERDT